MPHPSLHIKTLPHQRLIIFEGNIRLIDYTVWSKPFLMYLEERQHDPNIHIGFSKECQVDEGSLLAIVDLITWHNQNKESKRISFDRKGLQENIYAFGKMHVPLVDKGETLPRKIVLDDSEISQKVRRTLKERQKRYEGETSTLSSSPQSRSNVLTRGFGKILTSQGRSFSNIMHTLSMFVGFFGNVLFKSLLCVRRKDAFPWMSFFYHMHHVGLLAVPIIALISFLIGMVLAYQGINQLERFGAEIYTIDFLTIGVFREIGVLLTAVVVAGRSASAFTAQIGTMSLNQELDAMAVMQLDTILYLVLPRICALLLSLPLLVFLSDIMALLGGMLTTFLVIDLSPVQFLTYLQRAFTPATFWVGMSKAPLFALLIGLIGCFRGIQVRGSAESVGKLTTTSVVEAIFLVIIANAFMSLVFSYLKI